MTRRYTWEAYYFLKRKKGEWIDGEEMLMKGVKMR